MYNISMSIRSRKGFTIIEVTLFLAITAALLAGILAGSVASIKRHRYNDSVNDFVEFLRRTYSEVINVENERIGTIGDSNSCSIIGMVDSASKLNGISDGTWTRWTKDGSIQTYDGLPGRSQCAVYGMLITFGEDDGSRVYTYDVIGKTIEEHKNFNANTEYPTLNAALKAVNADIITLNVQNKNNEGIPSCQITAAGNSNYYDLQWDARAETPEGELFKGSVLIVRSPVSGTIHTLFIKEPIGAHAVIENTDNEYDVADAGGHCATGSLGGYIKAVEEHRLMAPYIDDEEDEVEQFETAEINICVASNDSIDLDNQRRNVRILRDGRNATAVELVAADDLDQNKCITE